ncbi:hypothetical protein, partial [Actinobacillus pleuropneumoniae]
MSQEDAHKFLQVSNVKPLSPDRIFFGGLEDVVFRHGSKNWNRNCPGGGLKIDLGLAEEERSPGVT